MIKWEPRTIDVLAIIFTVGYFTVLVLVLFIPFPQTNQDVLNFLLGILSAAMLKIFDSYFSKDAANSATATAIRAMKAEPERGDIMKTLPVVFLFAFVIGLLLSSCATMSPEQMAQNAKDKNAIVACGQGTGPWGKVTTVYVDTNKINDNNTVTVDSECKVSVTGTKAVPPTK